MDLFFYLLDLVMNRNHAVKAVLRTFVIGKKILKDILEDANFSSSREFHYKSKLSCTRRVDFCCSSRDFPLLRKTIKLKRDLLKGLVKIKHCKGLKGN